MTANNREKLYDLIDDVKIAMLTTVEGGGTLHTRPMANQKADRAGVIWFSPRRIVRSRSISKAMPK